MNIQSKENKHSPDFCPNEEIRYTSGSGAVLGSAFWRTVKGIWGLH
jgi:hypothetical protein